jgi:putative transcriptional regulator
MIVNHLSRVMGEQRINMHRLARESGVSYSSLHALYHDQVKRVDFATLDKLCRALGVGVGELLEYRAPVE